MTVEKINSVTCSLNGISEYDTVKEKAILLNMQYK